ncbi:hypothetical protein [Cytobacillus oceanisediminis]|uniref:Uncharacterized protein n=1 Tax=Cytobacillus oceanisediminis 2691 TaxID=1196031 RepID=A0A160MC43_9BACI|nr:hypothetical protein [Cytobacillus oceanisediminis]AND40507.1 hypothetical protein A361_15570 [Cytobacillus oceanisediminis 2691]MCM3403193.1 hypothetical protein [Cytobacillus oceanisediminis]MDK7666254.1 hypothetical protein [Cytobacillus oceanisediminis]
MIDEVWNKTKNTFYTKSIQKLKEGFAYQLFDLTNASRDNHGLRILTFDELVRETARHLIV